MLLYLLIHLIYKKKQGTLNAPTILYVKAILFQLKLFLLFIFQNNKDNHTNYNCHQDQN